MLPSLNLGSSVTSLAAGAGSRLFVELGGNEIAQIDSTTGGSTGPNVPVNVYGGGLRTTPDGNTLYYANYGVSPGSLYKIDVSTATPIVVWSNGTNDIGENGEDLTLSHNGAMLAYVCGYGDEGYQIPNFQTGDMSLGGVFPTGPYPDSLAYSPNDQYAYAAPASILRRSTSTIRRIPRRRPIRRTGSML